MTARILPWILFAVGVAIGLTSWSVQGPLPGDLAATRAVQGLFGNRPPWAEQLTTSATDPWMWGVGIICALVAGFVRNGRAGVGIAIGFAVALAMDRLLRLFLYVPRPTAELVAVAKPSDTSGLPSTFGLVYGATVGVLMLIALGRKDSAGRILVVLLGVLLIAGALARVTMGGHWPSQLIASYALSMGMGVAVLRYGNAH